MEEESEAERRRWEEACRREAVVRELLRKSPKRLTIKSVENAAWELGLSRATMYRLIDRYRANSAVSGLLPGQRGRPTGFRILTPEQEASARSFSAQQLQLALPRQQTARPKCHRHPVSPRSSREENRATLRFAL
jgi:Winged helix-turn helix